jgi:hypothetical protein
MDTHSIRGRKTVHVNCGQGHARATNISDGPKFTGSLDLGLGFNALFLCLFVWLVACFFVCLFVCLFVVCLFKKRTKEVTNNAIRTHRCSTKL